MFYTTELASKWIPRWLRLLIRILLFTAVISLFTKGFLLTRHELVTPLLLHDDAVAAVHTEGDVTQEEKPSKVIFMVIDALRYDFARYDAKLATAAAAANKKKPAVEVHVPPYRNKLKIFKDLAEKKGCDKVRLFR